MIETIREDEYEISMDLYRRHFMVQANKEIEAAKKKGEIYSFQESTKIK